MSFSLLGPRFEPPSRAKVPVPVASARRRAGTAKCRAPQQRAAFCSKKVCPARAKRTGKYAGSVYFIGVN
jgi:hypothetical protein